VFFFKGMFLILKEGKLEFISVTAVESQTYLIHVFVSYIISTIDLCMYCLNLDRFFDL